MWRSTGPLGNRERFGDLLIRGFAITLTTEQTGEIPQLAQIIQRSVKAIGINMTLKIETATAYFAGSQDGPPSGWGTTPWLNSPMSTAFRPASETRRAPQVCVRCNSPKKSSKGLPCLGE